MLEVALAAGFFVALTALTIVRARRTSRTPDVSPMKAALERRMREGVEFTL